ncbi:MAG: hypothetical protein IKC22_03125 [Bacilli bacterium]|nr:hypothetical protein [Bacilli bacterium]
MIIIVTHKNINVDDALIINDKVQIIDDYHLSYQNQIIEFDYLITDDMNLLTDLEKTNILIDIDVPVTNFFGQTSIEHIYIGDIFNALDHLYNGE